MKTNRDVANIVILLPETKETLLHKKTMDYPMLPYKEGRWFIFGGVVEEGETPVAAARREFSEETGFNSDNLVFSHESYYHVPDLCEGQKYVFIHEQPNRDLSNYRITEGAGMALFAMPELKDVKVNKYDNQDLERILKGRGWLK